MMETETGLMQSLITLQVSKKKSRHKMTGVKLLL